MTNVDISKGHHQNSIVTFVCWIDCFLALWYPQAKKSAPHPSSCSLACHPLNNARSLPKTMLFRGFILAAALGASSPLASAFVPQQAISSGGSTSTSLRATVDPSVVTKKEYQDICGVDFDDQTLEERLTRTKFLYPKHVEVIEDLAPIAGAMVDDVVSSMLRS